MKKTLTLPKLPIKSNEEKKIEQNIKDNNKSFILPNILPNISNPKLILDPNKKYKLKVKPINLTTKISFLILGATGDGKSQLGNFILNNPEAFKVSDDINSETKETIGKYGINGAENLFVIDTPGLQDTEEKDKQILEQMANYVKNHGSLHAIIIVLNFTVDRLSGYIQDMLKVFINMFPIPNFWEHTCFVFTHYYAEMIEKNEPKKQNKIEKFSELIINMIQNFKDIKNDVQIPDKSNLRFYFVDTDMENEEGKDSNSIEEMNRLIGWASSLETFETEKIKKVDNKIIDVRYEYQTRQVNSSWYKNKETINYVKEKRKVEKLYCGKESFHPWEIIENFSNVVVHEPVIVKKDKKWKEEKSSYFILNVEYITISHYYKEINIYNDDTEKESNWIYDHMENKTIKHPKELKSTETEYKRTYSSRTTQTMRIDYTYIWSRLKKEYNDLSVEYTEWKIIDTYQNVTRIPPVLLRVNRENFVARDWTPVIADKFYYRDIFYYSDGSVTYGNWILQGVKLIF